ncbi:hypothetical protein OSTOST_16594, partial [Ostertagia ostertagi]
CESSAKLHVCQLSINCDCGDYPCDPKDGTCLCPVGLSGPKCKQDPNSVAKRGDLPEDWEWRARR